MSSITPSSIATSFTRSQISSLTATLVDFSILVFLVEICGLWYVTSTALGAFAGAVTNFLMGRHWSFRKTVNPDMTVNRELHAQIFKYALVSGASLGLNSFGVYVFTEHFGLMYAVSKMIVALLIGIFFNFPLHRSFVFR